MTHPRRQWKRVAPWGALPSALNRLALLLLAATVASALLAQAPAPSPGMPPDDPLAEGANPNDDAVKTFIARHGGTPVLRDGALTFLVESEPETVPEIIGDFNDWGGDGRRSSLRLERLGATRFFVGSVRVPADSRVEYLIAIGEREFTDPLNPTSTESFEGRNSEVRLPSYRAPEGRDATGPLDGRIETFDHQSAGDDAARRVIVYLPAGYDSAPRQAYPTFWMNDGSAYAGSVRAPAIASALLRAGRIEPLILVLVDPIVRRTDYGGSAAFRRAVCEELVPRIDGAYRTIRRAESRTIGGGSRGGFGALDIALHCPAVFGRAAAWAPAISPRSIADLIQERSPMGLFWIARHRYDEDWGADADAASNALGGPRSRVNFILTPEGHTLGAWRSAVAKAMVDLFPAANEESRLSARKGLTR